MGEKTDMNRANEVRPMFRRPVSYTHLLNTDSIPIHSPNPLPLDEDEAAAPPPERTGSRKETAYQIYRDLILENIEYDTLTQNPRIDREQLDEIVDILLETVCTSQMCIRDSSNIDAKDIFAFLVDDRIRSNHGLTGLAVADNQLTLAAANGNH